MEGFEKAQKEFIRAVRDPAVFKAKNDDERRRMGIYQSLFFNNINGFLQSGFPVLYSVVNNEVWNKVVRSFFIEHQCRSPYFAQVSKEFVEYLSSEPESLGWLPPFSGELAHYEWLELDISIRRASNTLVTRGKGTVAMSPFASLVSYAYPVHLIGEDFLPDEPSSERNYYVVYRKNDYSIRFLHINAMTALMLQHIESANGHITQKQLCNQLEVDAPHIDTKVLRNGVEDVLAKMLEEDVILPQ